MVSQTAFQFTLDFHTSKPVVVEPSAEQVSSDAGLLPFRQLDEQLGLTRQFAEALSDRRNVGYIGHSFLEITRMRVYGIRVLPEWACQSRFAFPTHRPHCDCAIESVSASRLKIRTTPQFIGRTAASSVGLMQTALFGMMTRILDMRYQVVRVS